MIIGICGKAGSGKDTVADYLIKNKGYKCDILAAPIKRAVMDIFVLDEETVYDRVKREQPLPQWPGWTVRKLLQYVGTELFREHIDNEIWVKSLCMRLDRDQDSNWVIPDVRFPDEHRGLQRHFGERFRLLHVYRPGYYGQTLGGIEGHASEKHDLTAMAYAILNNEGSIADLYAKVEKMWKENQWDIER
jgi:hypothetical protein